MAIRLKHVLLGTLVVLVLVVIGGITAVGWEIVLGPDARPVTDRKFEVTEARLARGKYLAEGPMHCFHCHTEHDLSVPTGPIVEAKKGAGFVLPIPELNNIAAPNITPDPQTGIGAWTDDEIARAIREGVRKDGAALFPIMPYTAWRGVSDEDVASVVVYLRTIPAVKNTVPKRGLPFPLELIVKTIPEPLLQPVPAHAAATPAERGRYIATLADCAGCHTPMEGGTPLEGYAYGGGNYFGPPGPGLPSAVSVNITPDPSGIAHYDESLFRETLRTGTMGGRLLNHTMPFNHYKQLTDEDIADLFAFLKTLTPVQHRVSNTDPATPCPICNKSHGLGDRNTAPGR